MTLKEELIKLSEGELIKKTLLEKTVQEMKQVAQEGKRSYKTESYGGRENLDEIKPTLEAEGLEVSVHEHYSDRLCMDFYYLLIKW